MVHLLKNIETIVVKIEKIIVMLTMILLATGGIFKLVARNFMTSRAAIDISDNITSLVPHLVVLLGFYGASLGLSRNEVIKIDISRYLFNKKQMNVISKISFIVTGAMMAVFLNLAISSIEFGDKIWIIAGYLPVISIILFKSFIRIFFKYVE